MSIQSDGPYFIQWKGRRSGPFPLSAIRVKLNQGEFSRAHQILVDDRLMSLGEFLERTDGRERPVRQPLVGIPVRDGKKVPEVGPAYPGTAQGVGIPIIPARDSGGGAGNSVGGLRASFSGQESPGAGLPSDSDVGRVELKEGGALPQSLALADVLIIGKDTQCHIVLNESQISYFHAKITRLDLRCFVKDLDSTTGTYVNGIRVRETSEIRDGDKLRVGTYTFLKSGGFLIPSSEKNNARIEVQNLSKTVISRDSKQEIKLLDNVSFVINPKEFVALLGPSGSGKSTLMDAINGRRPASSGRLWVNDDDFYLSYQYYRRAIGYVPQQDIVHVTLSVAQALRFAALLRLPTDSSAEDIERLVDRVIQKLGLTERKNTLIGNLSGGQIKRVSLGVELISDPSLLFLDEATSGLDAGTEGKMMSLFRKLADEGATVVCITHNVDNVNLCDQVVLLSRGKLAYYGPPAEMLAYFEVEKLGDVYDRLERDSGMDWASHYQRSEQYQRYIVDRQQAPTSAPRAEGPRAPLNTASGQTAAEWFRQFQVLSRRYAVSLFRDYKNLAILLLQAPIIGALIGMVFYTNEPNRRDHALILFLMVISAVWFGCANAAKEIVKELPIYLRERAINLKLIPYLASKAVILSALCALQCLVLVGTVLPLTAIEAQVFPLWGVLFLTSLSGVMMGLVVSSLVDNTDKASAVGPILLIPQVILANVITPLQGVPLNVSRFLVVSYWACDAAFDAKMAWTKSMTVIVAFIVMLGILAVFALRRKDVLR